LEEYFWSSDEHGFAIQQWIKFDSHSKGLGQTKGTISVEVCVVFSTFQLLSIAFDWCLIM